jgi:hypothetical protein
MKRISADRTDFLGFRSFAVRAAHAASILQMTLSP